MRRVRDREVECRLCTERLYRRLPDRHYLAGVRSSELSAADSQSYVMTNTENDYAYLYSEDYQQAYTLSISSL